MYYETVEDAREVSHESSMKGLGNSGAVQWGSETQKFGIKQVD